MKKLLFLATVITLTMASCAKDRSCTCTETNTDGDPPYTYKRTIVESTKGQAKANCVSTTMISDGVTYTTDCKLD